MRSLLAGGRAELRIPARRREQLRATTALQLCARARTLAAVSGILNCLPTFIAAAEVSRALARRTISKRLDESNGSMGAVKATAETS